MDGERDGGEREGEVWRPRFSSRDVNNDRNDRIRPRPLVFRVTSGRVTADNARLVAWRFPNRGRNPPPPPPPFLSPFNGPLFDCPSSSSSSSSCAAFRWIVVGSTTLRDTSAEGARIYSAARIYADV